MNTLDNYCYNNLDCNIVAWRSADFRDNQCVTDFIIYVEREFLRLEKQNEIFKSALEFYSDKNSIGYNTSVARKALEEIKELE